MKWVFQKGKDCMKIVREKLSNDSSNEFVLKIAKTFCKREKFSYF